MSETTLTEDQKPDALIALLDRLQEIGQDKRNGAEKKNLTRKVMELIQLQPAAIAQKLGIAEITVSRWVDGVNAPQATQIRQLRNLAVELQNPNRGRLPLVHFGTELANLIGLYQAVDHFFERVADDRNNKVYVDEVYVFKSLTGFHAGDQGETKENLSLLLERHRGLKIHYIYPSEEKGEPTEAQKTFVKMKESYTLRTVQEQIVDHPVPLRQEYFETLVKLGLGYSHCGYFVLKYNPAGKDRYSRDLDILVELPCQRYTESGSFHDKYGPEYLFVELPQNMVSEQWKIWEKAIEEADHQRRRESSTPSKRKAETK